MSHTYSLLVGLAPLAPSARGFESICEKKKEKKEEKMKKKKKKERLSA